MQSNLKLIPFIAFLSVISAFISCSDSQTFSDPTLSSLDSLLNRQDDLERAKLIRIAELRQKKSKATSLSDRYFINSMLLDEFSTYSSDSAMKYVDENLEIASLAANKEWEIRNKIFKSELLAGSGLLAQSENIMHSIDRTQLPNDLLTDYYGQMIFLYSHLGNYTGGNVNDYYVRERAYKDSIITVIDSSHPDYLWYKGWDVLGTDKSDTEVINALRERLDHSELNTRKDAKDAYILAKLYEQKGDP